jgi:hypothetical protein
VVSEMPRQKIGGIKELYPTDNREQLYETDEDIQVQGVEWVPADESTVQLTVGYALDCGASVVARSSSFKTEEFHRRVVRPGYEYLPMDDDERCELATWYIELSLPTHELQRPDIIRLERVVAANKRIDGPVRAAGLLHPEYRQPRFAKEHFHESFSWSAGNFPYTGESQMDPDRIVMLIFNSKILLLLPLVLPALYGGIHLVVANFDFPSAIERLLWKIASIDIIVTTPAFFTLTWIGHFISGFFGEDDEEGCCCSVSYKFPGHILLFMYIFCRLFIVESFISLRHVPIGVFWTPYEENGLPMNGQGNIL